MRSAGGYVLCLVLGAVLGTVLFCAPTRQAMPLLIGTRFGSFEVAAPFGAGGMGACGLREPRSRRAHRAWGWGPTPLEEVNR